MSEINDVTARELGYEDDPQHAYTGRLIKHVMVGDVHLFTIRLTFDAADTYAERWHMRTWMYARDSDGLELKARVMTTAGIQQNERRFRAAFRAMKCLPIKGTIPPLTQIAEAAEHEPTAY